MGSTREKGIDFSRGAGSRLPTAERALLREQGRAENGNNGTLIIRIIWTRCGAARRVIRFHAQREIIDCDGKPVRKLDRLHPKLTDKQKMEKMN